MTASNQGLPSDDVHLPIEPPAVHSKVRPRNELVEFFAQLTMLSRRISHFGEAVNQRVLELEREELRRATR